MKTNIDLFRNVLLSAQRAILGEIYVEIRAIAIGFDSTTLTIICYLDRMPIEDDYENLSNIAGQILADIDFETVEEKCVFSNEPISNLNRLESFIYARKEFDRSQLAQAEISSTASASVSLVPTTLSKQNKLQPDRADMQ